jgi:hypothetical protein
VSSEFAEKQDWAVRVGRRSGWLTPVILAMQEANSS